MSRRRIRAVWVMLGALVMIGALAACGGGSQADANGDPARGKAIYATGGAAGIPCATCHTLDGLQLVGPSFQGIATRAATRVQGLSAEDYIRQSIKEPQKFIVPGFESSAKMPLIFAEKLSDEDIKDVTAYLMTLR